MAPKRKVKDEYESNSDFVDDEEEEVPKKKKPAAKKKAAGKHRTLDGGLIGLDPPPATPWNWPETECGYKPCA
jgi:hypothetical protein